MSSRLAEKQRRRQERVEREQEMAQHEGRARARRRAWGGVTAAAAIAAIVGAMVIGGGGGTSSRARAAEPFAPRYAGLDARRSAAGVPTMMDTMSSSVHIHPRMRITVDGRPIPVPANIGIDPSKDPMQMAGLHTHDTTGTIHVEGMAGATLGQFFAVWGLPFSATRLGPYRGAQVRMLVNGRPSSSYGRLRLADHQLIAIIVRTGRRAR